MHLDQGIPASGIKEVELKSLRNESSKNIVNLGKIEDIQSISQYYDLQLLNYEKPSKEKWLELRSLVLHYFETIGLPQNDRKFKGIYDILVENETLISKEEWENLISLFMRVRGIEVTHEIWEKVKHFFIYS